MTPEPSMLLSERDAAELLGISPRKLFDLAADPASGIVPVRIGRLKRYSRSALTEWIEVQLRAGQGHRDDADT